MNIPNSIPPEEKFRQPGAFDHDRHKSWFTAHHILAYILFGMLGLAIVTSSLFYIQYRRTKLGFEPVVHHAATVSTDWKTYTNTQYGFEINFTDGWKGYKVINDNKSIEFSFTYMAEDNKEVAWTALTISTMSLSDYQKMEDLNEPRPFNLGSKDGRLTFIAILPQDGPPPSFSKNFYNNLDYNQILSTFKFIK